MSKGYMGFLFVISGLLAGFVFYGLSSRPAISNRAYTVESFTTDLTIRIQCSGDCDLAAMIAEAREAAE